LILWWKEVRAASLLQRSKPTRAKRKKKNEI
jgi:hypothetical protein